MKMSKKALSAAITMSLVLGVYGVAGATNLYGVGTNGTKPDTSVENTSPEKAVTTDSSGAGTTGANYSVTGGIWNITVGGISATANVTGNTVTVKGGTFAYAKNTGIVSKCFSSSIVGGMSDLTYESSGNIVNIEGTVGALQNSLEIDGGNNAGEGDVIGNTVNVLPGSSLGSNDVEIYITGGLSENGKAEKNIVNITGGIINSSYGEIVGGYVNAGSGAASSNTVNISGGTVNGNVYGGQVYGSGAASSNTVNISGGEITGYVLGACAKGDAKNNTVTISGDSTKITGSVYGGDSDSDNAEGNIVAISGGTVNGNVYCGVARGSGAASSNTVNISGGEITGYVLGAWAKGDAKNNTVTISGDSTKITGDVAGGYSAGSKSEENTINISGGTINSDVYGGYAKNENGEAEAEENTVNISGGTITGNVYGGYAYSTSSKFELEENTINLGAKDGTGKATIGGDVYLNAATADGTTITSMAGGTLNVYSLGNTMGKNLYANGASVNFYIPATANSGSTMLTVASTAYLDGANVTVGIQAGSKLKKDDKITLIDAQSITVSLPSATTMTEAGYKKYELGINVVNNEDLVATVLKTGAGENAKSPLETMAASLSMLNMGGDMLATEGLESAVAAAKAGKTESEIFAAVGGNKSKIKTGSHVDLKGVTMNLGFAKEIANKSGKLIIGPVVEYGHGTYDSYLDNGYHGEGNSKYWGLGVIAKQLNNSGMYYEGSLRGGKVENDCSAAQGGYDADAKYIAAHLGVGKVVKLNDKNNIDVYAKYFLTHQSGSDAVNADNTFDFSCATSNRTRLGARYNHSFTEKNSIYGGLAWQYEFSGENKGTIDGNSVEAPTIKGHTGILELGWKANPTKNFDISIGMNGYTGVERGVGASVKLNWKF